MQISMEFKKAEICREEGLFIEINQTILLLEGDFLS